MEKRYTQPDQNNKRTKMKFITNDTYNVPLFRNICDYQHNGKLYSVSGEMSDKKVNMSTQYTKNSKKTLDETDDAFDDEFDSQYFPGFSTKTDNTTKDEEMSINDKQYRTACNSGRGIRYSEKSRYIDHGSYVPGASMQVGGFGNLDNFSSHKFGTATRNDHETISDKEIDRFHYTYRNYQHEHLGSNPFPEDTRHYNKEFN